MGITQAEYDFLMVQDKSFDDLSHLFNLAQHHFSGLDKSIP